MIQLKRSNPLYSCFVTAAVTSVSDAVRWEDHTLQPSTAVAASWRRWDAPAGGGSGVDRWGRWTRMSLGDVSRFGGCWMHRWVIRWLNGRDDRSPFFQYSTQLLRRSIWFLFESIRHKGSLWLSPSSGTGSLLVFLHGHWESRRLRWLCSKMLKIEKHQDCSTIHIYACDMIQCFYMYLLMCIFHRVFIERSL